MSDELPPLERLLERTARRAAGGDIHPAELLERIQSAYVAGVNGSVAPNRVAVRLHPEDYRQLTPALPALREEAERLLREAGRRGGFQHVGDLLVLFAPDAAVRRGIPAVAVQFADTAHRPARAGGQETGVIHRHRGVELIIEGSTRVPLTHTPFTIGRGPGNDLVLASLAVSRQHARIVSAGADFVLEDLGSHNGIVVDGERLTAVALVEGVPVTLGTVTLKLERGRAP